MAISNGTAAAIALATTQPVPTHSSVGSGQLRACKTSGSSILMETVLLSIFFTFHSRVTSYGSLYAHQQAFAKSSVRYYAFPERSSPNRLASGST